MTTPSPYGRVAAGYRILGRLRRGPDATVYHAVREAGDLAVALKVLRTDAHIDAELSRIRALPQHPNIVRVVDHGRTHDGRPYLAMEYWPDGSYADLLSDTGPVDVDEAVRVGVAIASALQETHDVGLVHRDVTPGNILRGTDGPGLTDFGIASVPEDLAGTVDLDRLTPPHASPEALLRNPQDARSDIYSLGSTLWTLLAGHPPFADGETSPDPFEYRERTLHAPVPEVPGDDVPDWLRDVLRRAMAKDPDDRYPDAVAFADALRQRGGDATSAPGRHAAVAAVSESRPATTATEVSEVKEAETRPAVEEPTRAGSTAADSEAVKSKAADSRAAAPTMGFTPIVAPTVPVPVPRPAPLPIPTPPPSAHVPRPTPSAHVPMPTSSAHAPRPAPSTHVPMPAVAMPAVPVPGVPMPVSGPGGASTTPSSRPVSAQPAGQPVFAPSAPSQALVPLPPLPAYRASEADRDADRGPGWWTAEDAVPTNSPERLFVDDDRDRGGPQRKILASSVAVAVVAIVGLGAFLLAPAVRDSFRAAPVPTTEPAVTAPATTLPGIAPENVRLNDERIAVTLTWSDPSKGEAVFYVVGTPAGGAPATVANATRGKTTVRVNGLNPTVNYCFVLVAALSVDQVANSAEICTNRFTSATPPASAPVSPKPSA